MDKAKSSQPEVVRYEYEHLPDNAYSFAYELSDGQFKNEYGSFVKIGDRDVLVITGRYGYTDADGKEYIVNYTSDEKGFRASGNHLPNTGTDVAKPELQHIPASLIASLAG